ncbi:MAG: hypothetical protein ACRDY7_05265 [Acidimicrobiia bacterium]
MLRYVRAQWDRVGAWLLIGGGFLALLVGWLGVSDTTILAAQMPYIISGGMLGLALIGVGAMLWLSADLRDEWRKLDAMHEEMADTPLNAVVVADPPASGADGEMIDLNTESVAQSARR